MMLLLNTAHSKDHMLDEDLGRSHSVNLNVVSETDRPNVNAVRSFAGSELFTGDATSKPTN
jgi:hypothetical protein